MPKLDSNPERNPWWMLDLKQAHELERVTANGRVDCCWDQSLPLHLEVSPDGVEFTEVAQRAEPFDQTAPWVIELQKHRARFLRFTTLRASVLVLAEVEVQGEKLP